MFAAPRPAAPPVAVGTTDRIVGSPAPARPGRYRPAQPTPTMPPARHDRLGNVRRERPRLGSVPVEPARASVRQRTPEAMRAHARAGYRSGRAGYYVLVLPLNHPF